jgi:GT2 family glycosyltransferase
MEELKGVTGIKPTVDDRIDVIMPTHGRIDLTTRAIHALYENTSAKFHLIIVDDSDDLTPIYIEALQKEKGNITFIHSDEPFKCGNQIFNIGLEHCKYDFVATVMNSVFVEPEWEMVAIKLMKENPKIGAIGFKCLFPSGVIESAGIGMMGFTPVDLGREYPGHRLSSVYECPAVQWAFALLRKEAIKGNLEEDVFNGFKGWDDIDNCFVLRKNGWKVFYCGLGCGYHEPRSTRGSDTIESHQANRQNAEAFYKRWGYWDKYTGSSQAVENKKILEHKEDGKVELTV